MSAPVVIRPAEVGDVDGLVSVYIQSARYHETLVDSQVFCTPVEVLVRARYSETLSLVGGQTIVAEADGRVVGLIEVVLEDPSAPYEMIRAERRAYVEELAVAEDAQRRGIGAALLDAAERWARERGAIRLTLETHPDNRRSIPFYGQRGYRAVGVRLMKSL